MEVKMAARWHGTVTFHGEHSARVKTRRETPRAWQKYTYWKVEGPGGSITKIGNATRRGEASMTRMAIASVDEANGWLKPEKAEEGKRGGGKRPRERPWQPLSASSFTLPPPPPPLFLATHRKILPSLSFFYPPLPYNCHPHVKPNHFYQASRIFRITSTLGSPVTVCLFIQTTLLLLLLLPFDSSMRSIRGWSRFFVPRTK